MSNTPAGMDALPSLIERLARGFDGCFFRVRDVDIGQSIREDARALLTSQQGEAVQPMPPLPKPDYPAERGYADAWTADQMHAYVLADRASRLAGDTVQPSNHPAGAQASPNEQEEQQK